MKSVFIMLVSIIIAWSSSNATAQPFIEFHVQGSAFNSNNDTVYPFEMKGVVDASVPPTFNGGTIFLYELDGLESGDLGLERADTPVIGIPRPVDPELLGGTLTYRPLTGVLDVNIGQFNIEMRGMQGDFSGVEFSMPDDPDDYMLDASDPDAYASINLGIGIGVSWSLTSGYSSGPTITGGFTIQVQEVDDPYEPECLADINNDGFIDFFDISAYLQLFSAGCP